MPKTSGFGMIMTIMMLMMRPVASFQTPPPDPPPTTFGSTFSVGVVLPIQENYVTLQNILALQVESWKNSNPALVSRFGPTFLKPSNMHSSLKMRFLVAEDQQDGPRAMENAVDFVEGRYNHPIVNALFSGLESDIYEPVARYTSGSSTVHTVTSSWKSQSDKAVMPFAFRLASHPESFGDVAWDYMRMFKWRQCAVMYTFKADGQAMYEYFEQKISDAGMNDAILGVDLQSHRWSDMGIEAYFRTTTAVSIYDFRARLVIAFFEWTDSAELQLSMKATDISGPYYQILGSGYSLASPVSWYPLGGPHLRAMSFWEDLTKTTYTDKLWEMLNKMDGNDLVNNKDALYLNTFQAPHQFKTALAQTAIAKVKSGYAFTEETEAYALGRMWQTHMNAVNNMFHAGMTVAQMDGDSHRDYFTKAFQPITETFGLKNLVMDGHQDQKNTLQGFYYHMKTAGPAFDKVLEWQSGDTDSVATEGDLRTSVTAVPWVDGSSSALPPDALRRCQPSQLLDCGDNPNITWSKDCQGICRMCERGKYSDTNDVEECSKCDPGSTVNERQSGCSKCPAGQVETESGDGGQVCQDCPAGFFAQNEGTSECQQCKGGFWMDAPGSLGCLECGSGLSTISVGATTQEECICAEEQFMTCAIDPDKDVKECLRPSTEIVCQPCPEEMVCPKGSIANPDPFPTTNPGFMTLGEDPLTVYKCQPANWCPGGMPDACKGGRVGVACGVCPTGSMWTGETCGKCEGGESILGKILWPFLFIMGGVFYFATNRKPIRLPTASFMFTATATMTLTLVQTHGVFSTLDLNWPEGFVRDGMGASSIGNFNIDGLLMLQCAYGEDQTQRYILNIIVFPVFLLVLILLGVLSNILIPQKLAKFRMESHKVQNSMGAFMTIGFAAMGTLSCKPLNCYKHPGRDEASVFEMPAMICGTPEHVPMQVGGLVLMVFIICYYCVIAYVCYQAPRYAVEQGEKFIWRSQFLLNRYRQDTWYWGCILIPRGLLLALAAPAFPNDPHAQMNMTSIVLLIYLLLLCIVQPWKVPLLNLVDGFTTFMMCMLLSMVTAFIPKAAERLLDSYKVLMTTILCLEAFMVGGFMLLILGVVLLMGRKFQVLKGKYARVFAVQAVPNIEELAEQLMNMAETLTSTYKSGEELVPYFEKMHARDLLVVEEVLETFEVHGCEPEEKSGKRKSLKSQVSMMFLDKEREVAQQRLSQRRSERKSQQKGADLPSNANAKGGVEENPMIKEGQDPTASQTVVCYEVDGEKEFMI